MATINEQLAEERARVSMAYQSRTNRELRRIANTSTTANRFSWLEISVAEDTLTARAEANRLRMERIEYEATASSRRECPSYEA